MCILLLNFLVRGLGKHNSSAMCDAEPDLENETHSAPETCAEPQPGEPSLNLLDMPLEIFLKICSFLDADFISTLSAVCRRFEEILSDSVLWRCWVSRRLQHRYPALRHLRVWEDGEINWEEVCINIDRETRKWRNVATAVAHTIVEDVHYAGVDSILLMNNGAICASGGRDHGLALWRVSDVKSKCCGAGRPREHSVCASDPLIVMKTEAHRGWVWDLAADSATAATTLYSASWDNTVKAWDLETNLECKDTYECKMSVLAIVVKANLLMAGLYSRRVLTFDLRAGQAPVSSYKLHRGPVLKLQTHGDLVASLSEDRTIAIWDQKAGKALASNIKCTDERVYPACLNWSSAAMYVGDSKGSVHLVDPEQYVHRHSYRLWEDPPAGKPHDKVVGICQDLGSLVVASDTGEIKCLYPSDPLQEYASFHSKAKTITRIQYQNDILALGTCESTLEFWIPVEHTESAEL